MKDLMSVLSTLVLYITITTLLFAVGAYVAFKMKESRRPVVSKRPKPGSTGKPEEAIFQQYVPKDKDKK
jgi:hypothetical protein